MINKVALGAVLQTGNITVSGLRIRSSGAQSETTRASKTNMIKACFTLIENKLTNPGDKNIYIKIIDENQKTLKSENKGVGTPSIKDPIECAASEITIGLPIFL